MPEITGSVQCILIGDDFAFTTITEEGTGYREVFILWFSSVSTPANPSPGTRIIQSDWISLLRQAMANGTMVTLGTEDATPTIVVHVQLGP